MRLCLVNLKTGLVENVVEQGLMPTAPLDPVTGVPRYVENTSAPVGYSYVPDIKAGRTEVLSVVVAVTVDS